MATLSSTGELILGSLLVVAVVVLSVAGTLSGEAVTGLLGGVAGFVFGRRVPS